MTSAGEDSHVAQVRDAIADIDRRIIELLARRAELARRAGQLKRDAGLSTLDPGREAAVLRSVAALAREHDLNEDDARAVFWAIIAMCRHAQAQRT